MADRLSALREGFIMPKRAPLSSKVLDGPVFASVLQETRKLFWQTFLADCKLVIDLATFFLDLMNFRLLT